MEFDFSISFSDEKIQKEIAWCLSKAASLDAYEGKTLLDKIIDLEVFYWARGEVVERKGRGSMLLILALTKSASTIERLERFDLVGIEVFLQPFLGSFAPSNYYSYIAQENLTSSAPLLTSANRNCSLLAKASIEAGPKKVKEKFLKKRFLGLPGPLEKSINQ